MEDEIEDLDSTNETEEATEDLDIESTDEDSSDVEDIDSVKAKNRQLYARAKKAEAELKQAKAPKEQPIAIEKSESSLDEQKLNELLDKRELDSLELSDELKSEAKNYAKLNNVSIKKALSSDYISFLKEKDERKARLDEASLGGKGKAPVKTNFSADTKPTDFDMETEEGKARFEKWKEWAKKELG